MTDPFDDLITQAQQAERDNAGPVTRLAILLRAVLALTAEPPPTPAPAPAPDVPTRPEIAPPLDPNQPLFVDALPPTRRASTHHDLIAERLKSRPGTYALLPGGSYTMVSAIKSGTLKAYRPAGSFEAVMRQYGLYVRYVGNNREHP